MSTTPGPTFSISVSNVDGVAKAILALPVEMAKTALVRVVKKCGDLVLATAKSLCPVRYGFLRDRLISRANRLKDGVSFICAVGVARGPRIPIDTISRGPNRGHTIYATPTKYAHFVEMGTSTREATPFMRPALQNEAVNAVDLFSTEIEKEIDSAVLKVAYGKTPALP